jgi:hypothetical protein
MRKIVLSSVMAALLWAAPAHAALFTLDSYSISARTVDPGLVVWTQDLLAAPSVFTLDAVGDTFAANLFRIGTNERALNLDDLVPYLITVAFSFSTPEPGFGGSATGITGAAWLGTNFGYVVWDNPLLLAFGSTGLLSVSLSNGTFGLPGSTIVSATFKLLSADTPVSVPEPATWLLLGVGAAAAAAVRRRRHAQLA